MNKKEEVKRQETGQNVEKIFWEEMVKSSKKRKFQNE